MNPSSFLEGHVQQPGMDIDAMLYDVSNRMARAQLARQMSNSSSTYRQRTARVLKANSAGSSPQNVPRRRTTTASYKQPNYRSELYQAGLRRSQQDFGTQLNYECALINPARPVSWHPSSRGAPRSAARLSMQDMPQVPSRNSMGAYRTVAVNGLPTPMTQPDMNQDMPMDQPYFSLDNTSMSYQQQQQNDDYSGYDATGLSLASAYQSCTAFSSNNQLQYPMSMSDGYNAFSPMDYSTQTWAQNLSTFPTYTAPPSPDFLPIQNPADTWQGDNVDQTADLDLPQLPRSNSKELVGMGLYDHPDRLSLGMVSLAGSLLGGCGDPHRESVGKGLKLEETWEPPEEDKSSDGEEDNAEDAPYSDEEEEVPPAPVATNQMQPTYPQQFVDMSNQSFFFEDEYADATGFEQSNMGMSSNLQGVVLKDFVWS